MDVTIQNLTPETFLSDYHPENPGHLASAKRGFFQTSDGVRLGYQEGGNPRGPVVLFCYGLMCSSFHFKYQWEHLQKNHRLLMLDYRGHHISESPVSITTLGFKRFAQDLDEFLTQMKVREAVTVMGHSMGVNVALEFVERFSGRVERLVLMAGAATFPARRRIDVERIAFLNATMKIVDGLFPRLADRFWRKQAQAPGAEQIAGLVGFNPKLSKKKDIRRVIELMSGFSPRVFAHLLGEYLRHDRTDTLGRISVPTLIIGGENDKAVPPHFVELLHSRIRESRLVMIRDGSHCPQFDRPDEVNAALDRFLSETAKASA